MLTRKKCDARRLAIWLRLRMKPQVAESCERSSLTSGFTLLELLTVTTITGILMAIAAVGWIEFHKNHRLIIAQDQLYQALRQAQFEAKHQHLRWQASFQNVDGQGQWAIHSVNTLPMNATWTELPAGVHFDPDETTLRQDDGFYEVQFSPRGHVNGQLGRITVRAGEQSRLRRCVFVSTLLGALRKARDNEVPRQGRYCY